MKKIIVAGAKSRSEEAHHIRSALRQWGYNEAWINQCRDVALEYLPPTVIATVPRHFSDEIREAYKAIGKSLEWNLITTDAYEFFFAARDAGLSPSQQNAAALLYACTEALDDEALTDRVLKNILDAYAGLDLDAVWTGKKFKDGRKINTGGAIRKAIARLLKKDQTLKNPALWSAVADKPPRGWNALDNRTGKYLEGAKAGDSMGYERFCNVCGEERKKIKQ